MLNRNNLILKMLTTAQNMNLYDEVTPTIADNFINKYTSNKIISNTIAEIILMRFTCILQTALDFLKKYNKTIESLL